MEEEGEVGKAAWRRQPPGGGGGNLVGGSNISLQQCHRHKHTIRHPGTSAASERWSVGGEIFR